MLLKYFNLQQRVPNLHKSKMENQTKITLVRHAQSQLNIASREFRTKYNLPYILEELSKHKEFIHAVRCNPSFLDCDISGKGIEQCLKAQQHVRDIKPDIILVSPLLRTLRTCSLVFENHKDVPVVCQPLLAEAFRSACDIGSETGLKMQRFPSYNFDAVVEEGDFWFVKNDSQENQQKYFELLSNHEDKTHSEKCYQILNLMSKTFIHERPEQVRSRTNRIKQMIRDKYANNYKHIVVVAHFNIINYLLAKEFDDNSEPVDCLQVANCEVVHSFLQHMLQFN